MKDPCPALITLARFQSLSFVDGSCLPFEVCIPSNICAHVQQEYLLLVTLVTGYRWLRRMFAEHTCLTAEKSCHPIVIKHGSWTSPWTENYWILPTPKFQWFRASFCTLWLFNVAMAMFSCFDDWLSNLMILHDYFKSPQWLPFTSEKSVITLCIWNVNPMFNNKNNWYLGL